MINTTSHFWSCRYIEGGLSLSYNDARTCAVVQNGRGRPILQKVESGGSLNLDLILEKKSEIRKNNQTPERHPDCKGCPRLELRDWPRRSDQFDWIGITNYVYCNLKCNYCWLTYAPYSPMKDTKKRPPQAYSVKDIINHLLAENRILNGAVIDWGGGGEPTLNPDFEALFHAFYNIGALQWLHTNAVKMPKGLGNLQFDEDKLRILTSLDAGSADVYKAIKGRDHFDQVVANLTSYRELGARVVVKFIVVPENATEEEARRFVSVAEQIGVSTIITDIDYNSPEPTPEILRTLRQIKDFASERKITSRFEAVGSNSVSKALRDELNARPSNPGAARSLKPDVSSNGVDGA